MQSVTVRIGGRTRKTLRQLATQTGETMQAILDKAVEQYRRQQFWKEANAAFAELRNDPEAWKNELEERRLWDQTLADGLGPEEQENGRAAKVKRGKKHD